MMHVCAAATARIRQHLIAARNESGGTLPHPWQCQGSDRHAGERGLGAAQGSSAELRELAAEGLGELVSATGDAALKPFVVQITGPLIR